MQGTQLKLLSIAEPGELMGNARAIDNPNRGSNLGSDSRIETGHAEHSATPQGRQGKYIPGLTPCIGHRLG